MRILFNNFYKNNENHPKPEIDLISKALIAALKY